MRGWLASSRLVVPVGAVALSMISIQMGATVAKRLFPLVGAEGATALRLTLAALTMAVVFRPWRARVTRATVWPLVAYGAVLGAMNLTFYMALRTIPLGVAVAVEFLGPLSVAVTASRRAVDFVWIALAVLGLGLLLQLGGAAARLDLTGLAFALLAAVFWGLYIIVGKRAGDLFGGLTVSLGAAVAALLVLPFGLAHAGAALLDPKLLPLALIIALMTSAIPYSLEMVGLTRLPQRTFGVLMSLEPALGALFGLLFLSERLGMWQMIGIGAIITASIGAVATPNLAGRTPATSAAPP